MFVRRLSLFIAMLRASCAWCRDAQVHRPSIYTCPSMLEKRVRRDESDCWKIWKFGNRRSRDLAARCGSFGASADFSAVPLHQFNFTCEVSCNRGQWQPVGRRLSRAWRDIRHGLRTSTLLIHPGIEVGSVFGCAAFPIGFAGSVRVSTGGCGSMAMEKRGLP